MEGPLWRETLGRSLGSHDATELVGGMCHGNGCRQETTRLHAISCTKTGWSSLTHNRVLHQALARSLRESKVQFVVENTWPSRQRASEENGRLNPLRMDITTEVGALFDNHPRLKNKALLLDITIVNPCAGSNLGNAARHVGKHLADEVERKKNKYRGSFPATYAREVQPTSKFAKAQVEKKGARPFDPAPTVATGRLRTRPWPLTSRAEPAIFFGGPVAEKRRTSVARSRWQTTRSLSKMFSLLRRRPPLHPRTASTATLSPL